MLDNLDPGDGEGRASRRARSADMLDRGRRLLRRGDREPHGHGARAGGAGDARAAWRSSWPACCWPSTCRCSRPSRPSSGEVEMAWPRTLTAPLPGAAAAARGGGGRARAGRALSASSSWTWRSFAPDPEILQSVPVELMFRYNFLPYRRESGPAGAGDGRPHRHPGGGRAEPAPADADPARGGHARPRSRRRSSAARARSACWRRRRSPSRSRSSARTRTARRSSPSTRSRPTPSPDHPPRGLGGLRRPEPPRLGHPHRDPRQRGGDQVPHRRRAAAGHEAHRQGAPLHDHQPHQGHGRAGHRREARPPGRPLPGARSAGRSIDFRVSIMPSVHGEDAVIRILDKESLSEAVHLAAPRRPRLRREGAGPLPALHPRALRDGAGHRAHRLRQDHDPLRGALARSRPRRTRSSPSRTRSSTSCKGITQIPVNEKKGLTFARGLRSILRHDPDKIMVGEIRDAETADIAIQSALTGHLVFTTVHANNVIDVLGRFLNMKIEPYNFVSALNCVQAQRLVRMICAHCKRAGAGVAGAARWSRASTPHLRRRAGSTRARAAWSAAAPATRAAWPSRELLDLSDNVRELILARRSQRRDQAGGARGGHGLPARVGGDQGAGRPHHPPRDQQGHVRGGGVRRRREAAGRRPPAARPPAAACAGCAGTCVEPEPAARSRSRCARARWASCGPRARGGAVRPGRGGARGAAAGDAAALHDPAQRRGRRRVPRRRCAARWSGRASLGGAPGRAGAARSRGPRGPRAGGRGGGQARRARWTS